MTVIGRIREQEMERADMPRRRDSSADGLALLEYMNSYVTYDPCKIYKICYLSKMHSKQIQFGVFVMNKWESSSNF